MLCQNCGKRPAAVHFTQVINSRKVELYLCEQCAREKNAFSINVPMDIGNFFAGVTGIPAKITYANKKESRSVCKGCGENLEQFRKTGKMGCSKCYELYGDMIKPLLKRIHGSVEHTGKAPGKISESMRLTKEIGNLRKQLEDAVKREDYEKAAQLRDQIKDMNKKRDEQG